MQDLIFLHNRPYSRVKVRIGCHLDQSWNQLRHMGTSPLAETHWDGCLAGSPFVEVPLFSESMNLLPFLTICWILTVEPLKAERQILKQERAGVVLFSDASFGVVRIQL